MSSNILRTLLSCFTCIDVSVLGLRLTHSTYGPGRMFQPQAPVPQPQVPTDIRGNVVEATIFETKWAVRVINAGGVINFAMTESWPDHWTPGKKSNMDLMWEWIKTMQNNGDNGFKSLKIDPPMTVESQLRNRKPPVFIGAILSGHNFKNGHDAVGRPTLGMDSYILNRFDAKERAQVIMPSGRSMSVIARHDTVRATPMFERRGRVDLNELPDHSRRKQAVLRRKNSMENFEAGIAMLEHMPQEAKGFFNVPVFHSGKSHNVRTRDQWNSSAHFAQLGAPFIAGPSGSIEYLILSMEENCGGACSDGLIPWKLHHIREALIGLMTAALVAGGHHSIAECLAVAQAMGYFEKVPNVLQNYRVGLEGFTSYLTQLGVAPGRLQPPTQPHGENQQRGGRSEQNNSSDLERNGLGNEPQLVPSVAADTDLKTIREIMEILGISVVDNEKVMGNPFDDEEITEEITESWTWSEDALNPPPPPPPPPPAPFDDMQ